MVSNSEIFSVANLPENSILYISINVESNHPMRSLVEQTDPAPDLDLNRIVRILGPGSRRYFVDHVIDGTQGVAEIDFSKGQYKGVIIGCSAHSANTDAEPLAPWQQEVIELIRTAALEYEIPYLGICGGGQLGLLALGGKVGPNPAGVGFTPERERSLVIRGTEIALTESGRSDPLFTGCKPCFRMTAIHSDFMQKVPANSEFKVLANSSDIPNQAVAYKDHVRLLGLHPELDQSFLNETAEILVEANAFPQITRPVLRDAFRNIEPDRSSNYQILKNFLEHFCATYKHRQSPANQAYSATNQEV